MMLKSFEDSSSFNTNILKLLINKNEEKLACVLIACYEVEIDENIFDKTISAGMFEVLKTIFIHSKNYNKTKAQIYTFENLIDKIKKSGCEVHRKVEEVCRWRMLSTENFLQILLSKSWDHLAIKYVYSFQEDADFKLLKFCIINENEDFLRYALNEQIFKQKIIDCPETTLIIIQMLESKTCCNIVINLLLYSDFHNWGKENLNKLYLLLQRIEFTKTEDNLILMLQNPILSLSIICDILIKLGNTSANFKVPAKLLSEKLQNICLKLSQLLREDLIEKVYTEIDFKGRSTLRLATENGLEPVIKSLKVEELIETLWTGKETFECDGRNSCYSKLFYINETNLRFLKGKTFTIKDLITQNFRVQTEDEKFWFQFEFRRHSIEFIFNKELFSAIIITIVIQIVNLDYLLSWNRVEMSALTLDQQYAFAASDLEVYLKYNTTGLVVCVFLLFSVLLRAIFSIFSEIKLRRDKWTVMDLTLSILGIISYSFMSTLTIEEVLYSTRKKLISDWINCFLIVTVWFRFCIFILTIQTFSNLLSTFKKMIDSSFYFNFIIIGLLVLFASIFYTLFAFQDSSRFGTFFFAVRADFDGLTGNYAIVDYIFNDYVYICMFSLFLLLSNVIILNYLVAIISLEYELNIPKGMFAFLCFKYQYIEKYSLPLKDKWGYQELIIHPFPLNIFCIPALCFVFKKELMLKVSNILSYIIFWVENVIIILIFLIYEFILVVVIYLKTFARISKANSIFEFIKLFIAWAIIGIPVLVYTSFADAVRLVKVLRTNADPISKEINSEEFDNSKKSKVVIFSEVLETMKLIRDIMSKKKTESSEIKRRNANIDIMALVQPLLSDNESDKEDTDISKFMIKKYLIVNAWKKYRFNHLNNEPSQQSSKIYSNMFGKLLVNKILECANYNTSLKKSNNKSNNLMDEEDSEADVGSALVLNSNQSNSATQLFRLNNFNKYKKKKEKIIKEDFGFIPEDEINYVETLLSSFVIPQDASNIEQLNLSLALKCLPCRVQIHHFDRIELINFRNVHLAMIAFQNDDQDEIFGFYSEKNKRVLFSLEKTAFQIRNILSDIDKTVRDIKRKMNNKKLSRMDARLIDE